MGKEILLILSLMCVGSALANRCTKLGLYSLPDANSCTKYYICLHGQEIANECADGLFYDESVGNCNLEANTVCKLGSCPVDNVGMLSLVPSYESCSNYYVCIRGIASRMTCSEGLLYNPMKKACDFADRVVCATQQKITAHSVIECPPTGIAKLPNIEDCRKFHICVNGKSSEYSCANGQMYNYKAKRCDRAEKAKCYGSD